MPTPKIPGLKLKPLPHQTRLADKLEDPETQGQVAFHGLGSGKTVASINAAHRAGLPILAIMPASLRNNYRKALKQTGFKHPATVLSYEEAAKKIDDPAFRERAAKSFVVLDEAHRAAGENTGRNAMLAKLPGAKKLLLSGTPIRNTPEEIAPLINAAKPGALPSTPEGFRKQYLKTRTVPVGFWGRLKGEKPGKIKEPINLDKFRKAVHGAVDFYEAADRSAYPSSSEEIVEVPMGDKQHAAYQFVMGKYPHLAYRIAHGLPLDKDANADFKAFMSGPRQVSNHPAGFHRRATDTDAPKIQAMADEIEKRYKKDPNYRGYSYSTFLESGVDPLSRELTRRGIPHAKFTGEANDEERKKIVNDYNFGRNPHLLLSGAGAEGLDLKGTKLVQLMEPHWQEEQMDQVKGRGVRYHSHSHLPEKERHVEIQRFHAIPKPTWWERILGRKRTQAQGADEYIFHRAREKRDINAPFLKILQEEGSGEPGTKAAEKVACICVNPVDLRTPGLLVDIDMTLVDTSADVCPTTTGLQRVLPNRIEILTRFKQQGYMIVGVTNRSVYPNSNCSVDDIQAVNRETLELFDGLLEDIIYLPFGPTDHHKPAPTMLLYAIEHFKLDPTNTIFVGDAPCDAGAAAAANIPFVEAEDFFKDANVYTDLPEATCAVP